MIGARLGPYEVTAKLGEGGMGQVYRATDFRLGREVAIKVLPEAFAADRDRLARFEREAQALAQLQHPNVASIYGLEEVDGRQALVLELVEGSTLGERIAAGSLDVEEALQIARQIVAALEAAHEKGIVHRDLKPQNVMLTPGGQVKVLDFGLAKAMDPAGAASGEDSVSRLAASPTLTLGATLEGVLLGTAGYMAPEQAKGVSVDKRADIWAFGVVLWEMLTGRGLFTGDSVPETLAGVLKGEIDLDQLPPGVPPAIRRLLGRCLTRDPRNRLRDIGDARLELDAAAAGEPPSPATRPSRIRLMAAWLVAAGLAVALVAVWADRDDPAPSPVRRFAIDLPWQSVSNWTDFDVALSPKGTHFAYYGRRDNEVDVYVRALDSLDAVPLAEARHARNLTFSPDGEWVAILDDWGLRRVSIHGGQSQVVAEANMRAYGLSWGTGGDLLVGHPSGLLRAYAAGDPGEFEEVTRVDAAAGETGHVHPAHLPDDGHALMTIVGATRSRIGLVDLRSGEYRPLPLYGEHPSYSPSGHLVFRQGSSVLAVPFDLGNLAISGEPVPVLENVERGPYLAADGSMLYVPERGDENARLVWADREGYAKPIPGERLDYSHLALARKKNKALLNIGDEIYVRDLQTGTRRLLASEGAWFPIWSEDEDWVTYRGLFEGRAAILRQRADGSGVPERLHDEGVPTSWHPDRGELAFYDSSSDIWILPPDGDARRFLADPRANERSGRFSPDGQWLAYVSDKSGRFEVYVTPYPGPGRRDVVSVGGGMEPIWSSDGRELFYRRGGRMLAASMDFDEELTVGRSIELFDGPYTLDLMGHQRQDVAADGRFLMVENSDDFRIVLVQSWSEELSRLTMAGATP